MKLVTGLAVAGLMSLGMSGAAFAEAHTGNMLTCTISCNTSWSQCVAGGTDLMIASTPQQGAEKLQMNSQNAMSCGEQARACYSSCM